ncbi:hypothetical protein F4561_006541, partial [Lipingzhangella halophila]|nr:hypothetical protein [Lipingzhangella halophila]
TETARSRPRPLVSPLVHGPDSGMSTAEYALGLLPKTQT